ncbi:contractile injection system tape measure protein [Telmatobacter bradus]|uniref:contractile injection system tape measure protein n=1 Tax=Telmatobacter bradus TaxID=474953 RepID=UPI003B43A015
MLTTHQVWDFGFNVSFDSEAEAFGQQSRLRLFVSERLVEAAGEVLAKLDPADGCILRLDELQIDLGSLPMHGYYDKAEARFREQLEKQIRHSLHSLRPIVDSEKNQASASLMTAAQNEFDIVIWTLERGYLPWNVRSLKSSIFEEMLRRVIQQDGPRLSARLLQSQRKRSIARRIAWRVPPDLLDALAGLLGSDARTPNKPEEWESLLLCSISEEDAAEEQSVEDWHSMAGMALATGDEEWLSAQWESMVEEDALGIESILRNYGSRSDACAAMASRFTDSLLAGIVHLLEPQETDFIEATTCRPEIFRAAAAKQSESIKETREHLWEFTLSYLLTARGSHFNRRAYLENTIRRMAAHVNKDYAELLTSLTEVVKRIDASSALKTELLVLLAEMPQPLEVPPLQSNSIDIASVVTQVTEDLEAQIAHCTGMHGISKLISAYTRKYILDESGDPHNGHFYVASLLRQASAQYKVDAQSMLFGVLGALREIELPDTLAEELNSILYSLHTPWRMAHTESQLAEEARLHPSLLEVIERVEPASPTHSAALQNSSVTLLHGVEHFAHGAPDEFVSALLQLAKEVQDALHDRAELHRPEDFLAGFTRSYLANGRPFNRHFYIASLLRQTEHHFTIDRNSLLRGISKALAQINTRGMAAHELIQILRDLEAPWTDSVKQTLLTGELQLLRRIAADEKARWTMIEDLPLDVLRDLAQAAEPSSAALMREIADQPQFFEPALPQANPSTIRRLLWGFTFSYAMSDRGSSFNRRSYAASTIGKLAAHNNIRYEDLLAAFYALVQQSHLPSSIKAEFVPLFDAVEKQRPNDDSHSSAAPQFTATPSSPSLPQLLDDAKGKIAPNLIPQLQSQLAIWLTTPALLSHAEQEKVIGALDCLIDQSPEWFPLLLRNTLADPIAASHLIERLSEKQLARILYLIAPQNSQVLLHLADVITNLVDHATPAMKWRFLFTYLVQHRSFASEKMFVREFIAWLAARSKSQSSSELAALTAKRLRSANHSMHEADHDVIAEILEQVVRRSTTIKDKPTDFTAQAIFVYNAGQVLAGPFLSRLFSMTGLLEANKFRDDLAACRAIHLIQYLVDGTQCSSEHFLPLNKILCGLQPDEPIRCDIELTQAEKDTADILLQTMIAHWTALGHTSPQGLRESFLQREGMLKFTNDAWQLQVESRTFDMLLDKLPWSYKVTRFPWMHAALYVEWR